MATMRSSEETLRYIERLPLFESLTEREKSTLAAVLQPRGLQRGDLLCKEGDPGRSFYVTVQGTIEVLKELPDGRQEVLSTVGPNNFLGQVALIDRQTRSATLRASSTTLVLECSSDDFDRLFWAGTPFAYKLLDMMVTQLAGRLRDADREIYELFSNPQQTLLKLHDAALEVSRFVNDRDAYGDSRGGVR